MNRYAYHLGGGVDNFHLFKNSGSIVSDEDFAFGVLDLNCSVILNCAICLTILSMPRGPKLVLTTSATAKNVVKFESKSWITFCCNDVGGSNVSGLFGMDFCALILAGEYSAHLNSITL